MLKYYIESVKRLSTDKDGVVSFEYVIVGGLFLRRGHCCCFRVLVLTLSTVR